MRRSSHNSLLSRGRKAGLSAREIYSALSARSNEHDGPSMGQADCNGYVQQYNQEGQCIYQPRETNDG